MHILLACAKTMAAETGSLPRGVNPTYPLFQADAETLAHALSDYSATELADMLKCAPAIAADARLSYRNFDCNATLAPAGLRYTGTAFRELSFPTLSPEDMLWANQRLSICSFLYGLLRPLDLMQTYRLEGKVRLPATDDNKISAWWRPRLTDALIDRVNRNGGILLNLASNEMKELFDWRRVEREVKVVTPSFLIESASGKPRAVTVYSKMARGAMARFVITRRLDSAGSLSALADFDFLGFNLITSPADPSPAFIALPAK